MTDITETPNDAMHAFARARLREGRMPNQQAVALTAVLEQTIWPLIGVVSHAGRNAELALRLFVRQWSGHPDYQEEWKP